MRQLNQNTLVDIAKHSNKTLKIADFMVKSDYQFMYSEMARIGENSSDIEAIEAFNKDVQKTATQLKEVHELLSTVDEQDNVMHLKNDEKNLKTIFKDAYDPASKTIQFNSCSLMLHRTFDKNEIMNQIFQSTIGQNISEFKDMFKRRKKLFELDENALYNDEDKIYFLSIVKNKKQYQDSVKEIKNIGQGFADYRKSMELSDKNKIDNEITFNRSMIDSVAKNSTYITKKDGVVQLAAPHKKQKKIVNEINDFVKNNNVVAAIELDPETSLEAVNDVLNKINKTRFNLESEVVFKARKLGNYNANGLYMDSQNIVAVDIKNPSALIHEFVHAVDLGNSNIYNSKQRKDLVEKFRNHIDENNLPENKKDYFLRTEEVIARLGEVGYILNEFNYSANEKLSDFYERVSKEQINDDPFDLNVAKPVSVYFKMMKNAYFNLEKMSSDDLMEVKNYYQSYFGVQNNEIKPINLIKVDPERDTKKVIGKRLKHELKPISFFDKDNIAFALDYNKEKRIIDFDKLFNAFFSSPVDIGRTTKKYNNNTLNDQKNFFSELSKWIEKEENPYLTYSLINNFYPVSPHANFKISNGLREAIINDNELKFSEISDEKFKEFYELVEKRSNLSSVSSNNASQEQYDELYKVKGGINSLARKMMNDFKEKEEESSEHLLPLRKFCSSAYVLKKNERGNATSTLHIAAKTKLFSTMLKQIKEMTQEQGCDQIFSYAQKDDVAPFDALTNSKFIRSITTTPSTDPNSIEERKKVLSGLLDTEIGEKLIKNRENVYEPFKNESRASTLAGNIIGEQHNFDKIFKKLIGREMYEDFTNLYDNNSKLIDMLKMSGDLDVSFSKEEKKAHKEKFIWGEEKEAEKNELKTDVENLVNKKTQEIENVESVSNKKKVALDDKKESSEKTPNDKKKQSVSNQQLKLF